MANATRNTVAFSPEQLQAVIAEAIAAHEKNKQAQTKTDTTDQMNALCIKAFKKAGYNAADIKPRENIKTYNLWIEAGRKVKQGEKSIKVKCLRLFHLNQTEAISKQEQAKLLAEREARKTANKLAPVSPVAEPVKAVTATPKANSKPTATATQPQA
jgi:hypothetical protein